MLITCSTLSETRKENFMSIKTYITKFIGEMKWKETFIDRDKITVLIIYYTNCTHIFSANKLKIKELEIFKRDISYKMHNSRLKLISV